MSQLVATIHRPPNRPRGTTALLQSLRTASRLLRDPEGYMDDSRQRNGDPFWMLLPGVSPALVTGDPQWARALFSLPPNATAAAGAEPLEPVFGARSVILKSGQPHQQQRRLLTPSFRGERMRAFGSLMQQITRQSLSELSPGDSLLGHELAQQISLRVIIAAIFGVTSKETAAQFEQALVRFNPAFTPPLMLMPFLRRRFFSLGMWSRFVRTRNRVDELLQQQFDAIRNNEVPRGEDILSQLLDVRDDEGQGMTDEHLKHELRTMLVAGHDTTAVSLAWALYYLHAQPEIEEKLRDELATFGDSPTADQLATAPYLDAVCQESMRMHPVVPLVLRRLTRPLHVGHTEIPADINLAVSLRLLHTDPNIWDEPHQFRPERFLERKYSQWEFAPFGAGTKRCLGAAFAAYEMRIVLGTLLSSARFSLTASKPPEPRIRGIIIAQDNRVPMRFEARIPSHVAPAGESSSPRQCEMPH